MENENDSENKLITKYRDKMYIQRANILNNYAKQTQDKGQMYYIYDRNSKMLDGYNLCICEEENSSTIIESDKRELPNGAKIGSILRKIGNSFVLDEEATNEIAQEIDNMKNQLLEEQAEFLESKRIEGHIYELGEIDGDRAWLYDITDESSNEIEGLEEIDFPIELLNDSEEGDLYIYKDGRYQKKI